MAEKKKNVKGNKLISGEMQLSYPALFSEYKFNDDDKPYYKCDLLWPKDQNSFKKVDAEGKEHKKKDGSEYTDTEWYMLIAVSLLRKQFGADAKFGAVIDDLVLRKPIRDGDKKDNPSYKGKHYMTVKSYIKPTILLQDAQTEAESGDIYAGCVVRSSLFPEAYDSKVGKGVKFRLGNLQKLNDGERWGMETSKATDDFDSVAATPESFDSSEGFEDDQGLGAVDEGVPFEEDNIPF